MDATTKALTTGVYELLRHDQWPLATDSADLARHAVTEILRLDSPSRFVGRLAPEDLVCQHVPLAAGQLVLAELHAANRDASRYPEPDTLDIDRQQGRQLAFGAGEHYCLGANQAKLTIEVGLTTLSSGFPTLRLADPESVVWEHDGFVGVTSLPVMTAPAP